MVVVDQQGHTRSDLQETAGEVVYNGDAERPRDGEGDNNLAAEMGMNEEEEEEVDMEQYKPFDMYVKNWIYLYGDRAKFDDPTELPPMRHTDGPILPMCAVPIDTMEVFFVKVAQITGGLEWPLDVYGDVAVRDTLDRKRNYLFRRSREECQTLTSSQDSLLELTGPSRAILLLDNPAFEIDLKVKGKGESEDKALCSDVSGYDNIAYKGNVSYAMTVVVSSELSAVELRFAHMRCSLEATISAQITSGPAANFRARFTARTARVDEELVLLDTCGQGVSVAGDGKVALQRSVVVVEEVGKLILGFEAAQLGGDGDAGSGAAVEQKMKFRARSALRSEGYFVIGATRIHVLVAWSVLP